MFLPIDIKIEVGEFVTGYSMPYIDQHGMGQVDFIRGPVEEFNERLGLIKIETYPERIPMHRIEFFTFGGIQINNEEFDFDRMWEENHKFI